MQDRANVLPAARRAPLELTRTDDVSVRTYAKTLLRRIESESVKNDTPRSNNVRVVMITRGPGPEFRSVES